MLRGLYAPHDPAPSKPIRPRCPPAAGKKYDELGGLYAHTGIADHALSLAQGRAGLAKKVESYYATHPGLIVTLAGHSLGGGGSRASEVQLQGRHWANLHVSWPVTGSGDCNVVATRPSVSPPARPQLHIPDAIAAPSPPFTYALPPPPPIHTHRYDQHPDGLPAQDHGAGPCPSQVLGLRDPRLRGQSPAASGARHARPALLLPAALSYSLCNPGAAPCSQLPCHVPSYMHGRALPRPPSLRFSFPPHQ